MVKEGVTVGKDRIVLRVEMSKERRKETVKKVEA